jgi:hypothetical protein
VVWGLKFICHQMNGERHFPWHLIVLRASSKLRKATISVVMSVGLPVRPSVRMEQLYSRWTDLSA